MARRFTLDGHIGQLVVQGTRLTRDVAERVVGGSVSLSTTEVTQLDLSLVDNGFDTLRSGLFSAGTPTSRGSRCDFGGLPLEVRAIEVSPRGEDHALRITARSLGASAARRAKGNHVLRDLSPTEYVKRGAKLFGLKFVGQPSAKRHNIGRQKGESEYDVWQRLATELGYDCFEAAGVVYFGKPTWLIDQGEELVVAWKGRRTGEQIDQLPTCRRTGDDAKRLATVTANLRGALGRRALPGLRLSLDGVPTFDGRYMIDSVNLDLTDGSPVVVGASTAINPKPQPPGKKVRATGGDTSSSADGTTSTGATGAKSASAFVGVALAQLGDTYVYGAHPDPGVPDPSAFDCSGLVAYAAGRVGVPYPGTSSSQYDASIKISVEEAISTRGALLHAEGHIAISLGNGKTVEAANPGVGVVSYNAAGRFSGGGKIPGMRY